MTRCWSCDPVFGLLYMYAPLSVDCVMVKRYVYVTACLEALTVEEVCLRGCVSRGCNCVSVCCCELPCYESVGDTTVCCLS